MPSGCCGKAICRIGSPTDKSRLRSEPMHRWVPLSLSHPKKGTHVLLCPFTPFLSFVSRSSCTVTHALVLTVRASHVLPIRSHRHFLFLFHLTCNRLAFSFSTHILRALSLLSLL